MKPERKVVRIILRDAWDEVMSEEAQSPAYVTSMFEDVVELVDGIKDMREVALSYKGEYREDLLWSCYLDTVRAIKLLTQTFVADAETHKQAIIDRKLREERRQRA
jgi:hypothetical protein